MHDTALSVVEKNNNKQQTIGSRIKTLDHEIKVSDQQFVSDLSVGLAAEV